MSLAKLVSIFVSSGVGSKLKLGVRGGGGLDLSKTWTRKKKVSGYVENVHCKHRRRNLGGGEGLAPIFFFFAKSYITITRDLFLAIYR